MKEKIRDLEKGQLAYKDTEGDVIVLPMQDDEVRDAFITRLMNEFVEDRDVKELLDKFKQAYSKQKS